MSERGLVRKQIYSSKEAAQYLGVISEGTLRKWRCSSKKEGPDWVEIGGRIGYLARDLDAYIEKCRREPGDDFAA